MKEISENGTWGQGRLSAGACVVAVSLVAPRVVPELDVAVDG